jgi:hypothetical protein
MITLLCQNRFIFLWEAFQNERTSNGLKILIPVWEIMMKKIILRTRLMKNRILNYIWMAGMGADIYQLLLRLLFEKVLILNR